MSKRFKVKIEIILFGQFKILFVFIKIKNFNSLKFNIVSTFLYLHLIL